MLVTCSVFVLKIDRLFLAMTTTTVPSFGMEFNSVNECGKKKLSLELERTISTKERKTTPLDDHAVQKHNQLWKRTITAQTKFTNFIIDFL